jgi:hypothetical protein
MSSYPAIAKQPPGALDVFSPSHRLARKGERQVQRAILGHMVAEAIYDSASATRARMAVNGARRSMEVARQIADEANGDPTCLEIGAAFVTHHVAAELDDFDAVSRSL